MKTYIVKDGQQTGPFEDTELQAKLSAGVCSYEDLAWREGMTDWLPLRVLLSQTILPPPLPSPVPPIAATEMGDNAAMRILLPVGRSGWAIVAGYLGLFAMLVVPAPLALIVSIVAIRDIRRSRSLPHPKHGMGRAIFGLITGVLGTLLLLGVLIGSLLG